VSICYLSFQSRQRVSNSRRESRRTMYLENDTAWLAIYIFDTRQPILIIICRQ